MPIICQQPLNPLSREEFSRLSYDLMADVFAIRNELGRFFFHVLATDWREEAPGGKFFRDVLIALLEDWGASLELSLYEEALTHFLGGESNVLRPVKIYLDGAELGQQMFRLAADRVAFKLTALVSHFSQQRFVHHARQLVRHADLDALLWANLGRHEITFSCLRSGH